MKVWVVVSDCGLNGPWIHGVYTEKPDRKTLDQLIFDTSKTTGYQFTQALEFEVDGEPK